MAVQDEVFKVTLFYAMPAASQPQSVFHFKLFGGDLTDAEVISLINGWIVNDWGPAWEVFASQNAEIVASEIQAVNLDGTINRNLAATTHTGLQGTVASNIDPAAVSGFFYAPTTQPRQRGRKFVPGVADISTVNGVFTPGALSALINLAVTYLLRLPGPSDVPRLLPGVLSTTLLEFVTFLSTAQATDVPAYQRRRKPGVGT